MDRDRHYTCMKYDRPSMYSSPVNRSRLTVKHDRPSIISTPMNSTVHQYTVDKYIVKVDNQNHKRKVDRKVSPKLAITNFRIYQELASKCLF